MSTLTPLCFLKGIDLLHHPLCDPTMSASARMVMMVQAPSNWLTRAKGPDASRPSSPRARLRLPIQQTELCFACDCNGAEFQQKQLKQGRGLKIGRFPSKGLTTSVLDLKCFRRERKAVIFARSFDDKGPSLNRNEVVELLSEAIQTLLRPENQRRLREGLENSKQRIHLQQSKPLEEPSNVDPPAPTDCLQDVEEIRHLEMEDKTKDSGRCLSDQESTIQITSQPTELVELDGQARSIEDFQSFTGNVDGQENTSLTSIRRLKVLDVHSYVHNALRESALRSWLNSRTIEE